MHIQHLAIYQNALVLMQQVEAAVATLPEGQSFVPNLVEMADLLQLKKKIQRATEEVDKHLKRAIKQDEAVLCTVWMNDPEAEASIHTDYTTATPKPKVATPELKRAGNEVAYDAFCRKVLGITDVVLIESGAVNIHYKHWSEYWSNRVAEGYSLPTEVQKSIKEYKSFSVTCRAKTALLT